MPCTLVLFFDLWTVEGLVRGRLISSSLGDCCCLVVRWSGISQESQLNGSWNDVDG